MQVKIQHLADSALDLVDSLDRWNREHQQYYSKPCGWCEAIIPTPRGAYHAWYGRLIGQQARDLIRDIWGDNPPADARCGGWLTSAGNLTLVAGLVEYRRGRRHGVRHAAECGPGATWEYQSTMCPDVSPDAKDLVIA